MKTEVSAGGIIVRKVGGEWKVLLLRDMHDNLTFPKGMVEANESFEETAIREIHEEVGLTVQTPVNAFPIIRYMYTRGTLFSKSVHYYLFHYTGHEKLTPQKEEGIQLVVWMPLPDAIERVGYSKTNRPLLIATEKFLSSYGN